MHVRRLQLTAFRNYRNVDLDLAPGRLLFTGDNAQGKSNLLEAVQLIASGRSVRATADAELISFGTESEDQPFARLQASVNRRGGDVQLETLVVGASTSTAAPAQRAGKRFRVNGIPRRAIDFVGQLRSVLFTADDLTIISGSPSDRRLYLDVAISQLDRAYYGALQRFSRVLTQRNAVLRRIRDGLAGQDELPFWDESLVREGAIILSARRRAVSCLAELASIAHRELTGAALEDLVIAYEPQLGDEFRALLAPLTSVSDAQSLFAAALAAGRRRDLAAGLSLVGPHRDDLSIVIDGASAASFGSRAQIRTAALSLRLAEARLLLEASDDPPVVLLDDIVSELDEARRRSVLEGVGGFDQVWFTATSATSLPPEFVHSCIAYEVRAGSIRSNR